ncbi:hypothetical protein [Microbulbifer sp. ALW1]|uniref:hypothetical protein n=1 Tax=Microbulbifer sp. (strain ALW1) TaxID=1516059 RepID=UPI00135B6235|nr:hypothetical protein [Microbulbifer sp. ALW1]
MPVRLVPLGVIARHPRLLSGLSLRLWHSLCHCLCFSLCLSLCLLLGGCDFGGDSDRDPSSRALGSGSSSGSRSGSSSSGSGSSSGAGTGPELRGEFIGIQGLRFETPSFSGVTDSSGTFRYRAGEEVFFSLGGIALGSATGAPELNPFDLVDAVPFTEEAALRTALENHQRADVLDLVSNMMLLFLTLDRDRDLENGIDLSDWDTDLADYRLDLAYDLYAFPFRRGLDSLPAIKTAFDIDYWVPLEEPLVYLYDVLGILVPTLVPVRETRDFDDNNTIEQEVRWVYNDFGLPEDIRLTFLPDTANTWRERLLYDYDSVARPVFMLRETDTNEDETIDFFYRSERFFNDNGFLVEVIEEDGQPLLSERRNYRFNYDKGGNKTQFRYRQDINVDEIYDRFFRIENRYDDDGLLIVRLEESDLNGNGLLERRRRFEFFYNSAGLLVEQLDELDDGVSIAIDEVVDERMEATYRYSSSERLLRQTLRFDDNGDDIVDRENIYQFAYLSNGQLREEVWESDVNLDGTADFRRTFEYRYNSDDNLIRVEMSLDENGDDILEGRSLTEYRYNTRGQLRETEITTFNGNDEQQSVITITRVYGSRGQLENWYREGEGLTGISNTPLRLRWRYLEIDDGLRYLIDHFRYRQPMYTEVGTLDLNLPCWNYRFAEDGTLCALSWPQQWQLYWDEFWKAPGVNLGGPTVIRP